jgi:hypothetical protein
VTLVVPPELVRRGEYTAERLVVLSRAFRTFELEDEKYPSVAIYATGSLGRGELGRQSDLDLFIVDVGEKPLPNLERIPMLAALINAAAAAEFRPFSRDGQYLQVHRLSELEQALGTPDDEHLNLFTARMLLLLESHRLIGAAAYDRTINFVLDRYWLDAEEGRAFLPLFLMNDIVRYWKALCLSYEAERTPRPDDHAEAEDKAVSRLRNLKLRFNRAWMCFNALAYLLAFTEDGNLSKERARQMVDLAPAKRMLSISDRVAEASDEISKMLDHYAWFLAKTNYADDEQKEQVDEWLRSDDGWDEARARSGAFGDSIWRLITLLGERVGLTRYLLV